MSFLEITDMAVLRRQGSSPFADGFADWCHICGRRQTTNVEVWYPANAEHQHLDRMRVVGGGTNYIRICADCGEAIARIGRGEVDELVRNNPGTRRRRRLSKP